MKAHQIWKTALLMLGVVAATSAQADGKLQQVLSRGKIIVGTGNTNQPWHFRDDKGELAGFDIDVARMLAKGLFNDPTKVDFVIQAADSRIPNLTTDKVDITCQFMTVTAGRAQQVAFTIPYYREGFDLLLLKGGAYKDYDALKAGGSAVTISILQNVYAEEVVHEALPEATVDQYDSVDLMYQAVNSGRAAAAATDMSSVRWFMKTDPDRYLDAGHSWYPQTYACAVRQGDQDWLNFVNTALHEWMTGVDFKDYKASFQTWFSQTAPEPNIGFPTEMR